MKREEQLAKEIAKLDIEIGEFYQPAARAKVSAGEAQAPNAAPLLAKRKLLRDELLALKEGAANG